MNGKRELRTGPWGMDVQSAAFKSEIMKHSSNSFEDLVWKCYWIHGLRKISSKSTEPLDLIEKCITGNVGDVEAFLERALEIW